MVKVRHSEGVTGEVLSGESDVVRGADAVVACRRQQARVRHGEDLGHPASSLRTSLVRELLCGNREVFVPPWGNRSQDRIGKAGGHSR
jgi:hypothetical protein